MVCLRKLRHLVMSTTYAREVVCTCNRSQSKMQAVADLLLLTSDIRPVTTESLSVFGESFPKCRETIITRTKGLLVLTSAINKQLHSVTAKWQDIHDCIQEVTELVVSLTECCAHAAYIVATNKKDCTPAISGIIDRYKISRANVDIEQSCNRLKNATVEELTPQVLVDIGNDVKKNLEVLTECCMSATSKTIDSGNQDQFKLCIKSITACASCLLSSIRCFKSQPTLSHHKRCAAFCEPLSAATNALVNFAVEEQFTGTPAHLTQEAIDAKKAVLGACLSIVSSCIQLARTIKELAYDNTNVQHRTRIPMCTESISKASSQLAEALLQHHIEDRSIPTHRLSQLSLR